MLKFIYACLFDYKKILNCIKNHIAWLDNPKNYELNANTE